MLISQVELPVSDAVQAARFYGDVLGMLIRRLAASWRSASGCPCCRSSVARWSRARTTAQ